MKHHAEKVALLSAVEKLEADQVKTRAQGLEDVKRLWGQARSSILADGLEDDTLHLILESLFRVVRTEKPAYVRAAKANSRSSSKSRLGTAASTLRLVVDTVGDRLKQKTASAVLDHIISTLPDVDGGFCEPMQIDYLETFKSLLSYPPRAEHFRPKQWQTYVDFVVEHTAESFEGDTGGDEGGSPHEQARETTPGVNVSLRLSQSTVSKSHKQDSENSSVEAVPERLLTILRYLTGVTNAPLLTRLPQILELAVSRLKSTPRAKHEPVLASNLEPISRSEELALDIVNNLLPTALVEDVSLAGAVVSEVLLIVKQRKLWFKSKRNSRLREGMLVLMALSRSLFLNTSRDPPLITAALMDQLLDTMRTEYEQTPDAERLQMKDINLLESRGTLPLALVGVELSSNHPYVINAWSALSTMRYLLIGMAKKRSEVVRRHRGEASNKRVKLEDPLDETIKSATGPTGQDRLVALQLTLFVVDQTESVSETALNCLSQLNFADLEDEPTLASWTCLLLARIAILSPKGSALQFGFWRTVWTWACRASNASSISRPACYLLYAIVQSKSISSILSGQMICATIFPDGANGPGNLSDGAILLLRGVLSSGLLDTEKTFRHFSSRSLRWLDAQWTMPDRSRRHMARFAHSEALYTFLMSTMGKHVKTKTSKAPVISSSICETMLVDAKDLKFTQFMLSDGTDASEDSSSGVSSSPSYVPSSSALRQTTQIVSDILASKIKSFYAACRTSLVDRPVSGNLDALEIVATACVLCVTVGRTVASGQEWTVLQASVKSVWDVICDHLANSSRENFPEAFCRIATRLTDIELHDQHDQNALSVQRSDLVSALDVILGDKSESQEKVAVLDIDTMNSPPSRLSQGTQVRLSQRDNDTIRSDLGLSNDRQTSFSRQCLLLKLDAARARAEMDPRVHSSPMVIEAMSLLEPEDLLASRDIIFKFLEQDPALSRDDAYRLLTRMAEVCLQRPEYERCEVALCCCLHVTTYLTSMWIVGGDDDLANVAWDIYEWYVMTALGKGIASQRVLVLMACLLDKIMSYDSLYGTESLPSARTSLLQILRVGQTGVKYQLGAQLSHLFDGYVLSEHPAVFDDVIDNLPSDPDRQEGIAVRLYIITSLGARWHTILRQSVYHVFETAANVPATVNIAAKCIKAVCQTLDLDSPQELLRLFSPQVLYTWLEKESIESIPFNAFGYESLAALLDDVQDEIVAQVSMRNSADHAQKIVKHLGTSWDSLVEHWFAKTIVYAIISDVTTLRTSHEIGKAEIGLVQHLGEDAYAKLARHSFARAVSIVLLRMSDDRGFEKTSSQGSEVDEYTTRHRLICARSSSDMQLPPGQQPSFRAKHLIQILDRVCTRAQETLETMWTPALLVHVYRHLLADAKPAFGPLHMCAVLRKIRTVISLAGNVALSGYPLQMLLHALRPFLTQFHSSEDAFGIFWYLLEHGKGYLKNKLPFVTGLSVTCFASLSKFTSSSQESTTQESHFASTMSKAQSFRVWLGKYLEDIDVMDHEERTQSTFASIVQAAKQITKAGSSAKTTAEGSLLYHLLADQAQERPLLSNTFFRLTLHSLCHDFVATGDLQDDVLYSDEDVLEIAPVLRTILNYQNLQDAYRIWVAQALGRAYALEGPKIAELDSGCQDLPLYSRKSDIVVDDSYQNTVSLLVDLLWDEDRNCAGASEATLQSVFSALPPANKTAVLGTLVDTSIFEELRFCDLPCPSLSESVAEHAIDPQGRLHRHAGNIWASEIVKRLSEQHKDDPVLSFLPALIDTVPSLAPKILPFVVHLSLHFEIDRDQKTKNYLDEHFARTLDTESDFSRDHIQLVLKSIVYLRRCTMPSESSMGKRNTWLAIDFSAAAQAALRCEMYPTALLMLEISKSQHALTSSRSSRKMSHGDLSMASTIQAQIYQNIDDPDFFYGTHEESDVASVIEKLCHEGHGYKALSFQSALLDSNIKIGGLGYALNMSGDATMKTLSLANFNGLSNSIGSFMASEQQGHVPRQPLQTSLNLHQWEAAQDNSLVDHGTAIMTALRTLASTSQRNVTITATDQGTLELTQLLVKNVHRRAQQVHHWTSLAALAELKETVSTQGPEDLEALVRKRSIRRPWTEQEGFECIEPILLGREATLATIKNDPQLRSMMSISTPQAMLLEIKSLRWSLSLGHVHEMSQFCLNRAAYMSELLPSAMELGLKVEAAIQYDLANTFWSQQEHRASIRILQTLHERDLPDQAIEIGQSEILTDLGSKITEARFDRPDEVTAKYLLPAIKALGRETLGYKVGRVFHNFAAFCDSQLRDPDNVEEYEKMEKIRDHKWQEVRKLESMYKSGDSKTRDTVKAHFAKARTWFKLDDEELQRLKVHRDRLVRNCLENYLLSLRACEDFPNDVLRFLALWMEQSASAAANMSVGKHLSTVPTHKFAPLMNQLSSRILNEDTPFQQLLSDLIYRICEDHPFHSLYQIFATSKSKGAHKDEVANSRHAAATKLSDKIMRKSSVSNLWVSIHNTNIQFVRVAQESIADKELKTGSKLLLRKLLQGAKLEQTVQEMHQKIPPPTMKIAIRPDRDYSSVPTIVKFDAQISIAGGVSAPKIVTIVASDGSRHKMLLKGGNDDLRQDSIMEQVFEQVSNLLKDHRTTRQRKLGIRTYKVIPLTHNAGIIEFVRDTMPLHDYVLPAHTRYYPKDYKPNKCRKEIAEAQSKPPSQRLQAYRNVVANFHPVMRFFFMEHFLDPDDWFQKRLNYSRSTAAISILGHVLGLGDRHGHNILLDTRTGEVVHIDLGVAFEAGRVLPVPEVVPFRLTRDLVDGMGLSGVEGVFRRCCNFTLEALRQNQEAIMTILDVLRWDPLYSWSVSPLRLARMQENQEQAANGDVATASSETGDSKAVKAEAAAKQNSGNEPSEADRALAVVSKKLGKSLSVEATVNELIRQATDERNLAVLYCGWAAYA